MTRARAVSLFAVAGVCGAAGMLSACGGGQATRAEAVYRDRAAQILTEFDSNQDRMITRAELNERRRTSFQIADTNGDGFVTRGEAAEASARLTDLTAQTRLIREVGPARLDPATMDANRDGAVSLREYLATPVPLFARFDVDGDGQVTREELERREAYAPAEPSPPQAPRRAPPR